MVDHNVKIVYQYYKNMLVKACIIEWKIVVELGFGLIEIWNILSPFWVFEFLSFWIILFFNFSLLFKFFEFNLRCCFDEFQLSNSSRTTISYQLTAYLPLKACQNQNLSRNFTHCLSLSHTHSSSHSHTFPLSHTHTHSLSLSLNRSFNAWPCHKHILHT